MHILFLGVDNGNCKLRAQALVRIGHTITQIDPGLFMPTNKLARRLHRETGNLLVSKRIAAAVLHAARDVKFDAVWVDGGRFVGPELVRELGKKAPVSVFNVDDAYGYRDRLVWLLFRRATPEYDWMFVRRKENITEAKALGAKNVEFTFLTADEIAHRPRELTADEIARWSSDVVFVGTGMDRRGAFITDLLKRNVPLTLYGNNWETQREWPEVKLYWKGIGTTTAAEYSAAILAAKVNLGLLSKGNRDLHTRRSIEIPALGGVFCAERTSEHLELYVENEEAVFWSTSEECADACLRLLGDEQFRKKIARQGHERCLRNGHYNEPFCRHVLSRLMEPS